MCWPVPALQFLLHAHISASPATAWRLATQHHLKLAKTWTLGATDRCPKQGIVMVSEWSQICLTCSQQLFPPMNTTFGNTNCQFQQSHLFTTHHLDNSNPQAQSSDIDLHLGSSTCLQHYCPLDKGVPEGIVN